MPLPPTSSAPSRPNRRGGPCGHAPHQDRHSWRRLQPQENPQAPSMHPSPTGHGRWTRTTSGSHRRRCPMTALSTSGTSPRPHGSRSPNDTLNRHIDLSSLAPVPYHRWYRDVWPKRPVPGLWARPGGRTNKLTTKFPAIGQTSTGQRGPSSITVGLCGSSDWLDSCSGAGL